MFITVYVDADGQEMFCYQSEKQPQIPEEYMKHCNIAVFDTTKVKSDDQGFGDQLLRVFQNLGLNKEVQ